MALIQCDFFSDVLGLCCQMDVILPQPPAAKRKAVAAGKVRHPALLLLHGLSDDHTIWQRRTSIERYVEGLGLAVVMPAVHRSYYTDMVEGGRYWTFISQELPAIAASFFHLSTARADNFVAGLSMGGYGAFKLGLALPGRYAAAASLSGALDIARPRQDASAEKEFRRVFGNRERLRGSANDLFHLARKARRNGTRLQLYQCCGTDDFLYQDNVRFRDFARSLGLPLTYDESPGAHEWGYWDRQIQRVLQWLPLGASG
jgi:S-formylglutathione hydrolase FrmB